MFGFSNLSRRAREWHANRERHALQSVISRMPDYLRKDIGWPAGDTPPVSTKLRDSTRARPIV